MTIGIGYQDYIQKRIDNKEYNFCDRHLEAKGNERYLIYFGRAHVSDFETGIQVREHLKIGRGKFASAVMRGRNQCGIDFRIYIELILKYDKDTRIAEGIIKEMLEHRNIKTCSQGQTELYNIKDSELKKTVMTIVDVLKSETTMPILEINNYYDDEILLMSNKKRYRNTTLDNFFDETHL